MYKPLTFSPSGNAASSITTTFATGGINKRDYAQLLDTKFAIEIKNYLVQADGRLVKREGRTSEFTVAGGAAVTMLVKWSSTLWIYGYDNNVAVHDDTADTETVVKADFTTTDAFSCIKYGDYAFVCNGGDKIGRISKTLDYDAQTGNFAVGLVVTGGTSGATAIVLEDSDSGTTGTLTLGEISGTFANDEALTDSSTGAAVVNGTLGYTFTSITDAPKAKHLYIAGSRIFAGNLSGDIVESSQGNEATIVWATADDGTNPPFTDWTTVAVAGQPTPSEPSAARLRNAGAVQGFGSIGSQVIAVYDSGKLGFRIESVNVDTVGLVQEQAIDFQKIDFGGERGMASTPKGIFYCNEGGVFQMISGGSTNVPFSEQESNISLLLGTDLIDDLSFVASDIIYDPKRNNVMITCREDSSTNNLVLVYDLDNASWVKFTGWNINRFMLVNDIIYGADSTATTIYKLFDGESDNTVPIDTEYLQELPIGNFTERKDLELFYIQGQLSESSEITIAFDVYDKEGEIVHNKATFDWAASGDEGLFAGYGSASWGATPFGGDIENNALTSDFSGASLRIKNFQRLRIHITSNDSVPHQINLFQARVVNKGSIRRRNLNT